MDETESQFSDLPALMSDEDETPVQPPQHLPLNKKKSDAFENIMYQACLKRKQRLIDDIKNFLKQKDLSHQDRETTEHNLAVLTGEKDGQLKSLYPNSILTLDE